MTRKRYIDIYRTYLYPLVVLLLFIVTPVQSATRLDSCLNWPVMAVPVINHTPETRWVFGAAVQGYFHCPNQQRTSIVQLDGAYTLEKQWYLNTSGLIYFGKNNTQYANDENYAQQNSQWILGYSLNYRDYPDQYYERGNQFELKSGLSYRSQRFRLAAQPLYVLPAHWAVGIDLSYHYEQTTSHDSAFSPLPTVNYLGFGIVVQYDTRDVLFYPHQGIFFKLTVGDQETLNQHYQRLAYIRTDLRQFVPIYKDLIFAWQFRSAWALGKEVPFPLLPSLGGQDLLRGVRANMYRDNVMLALQAEMRIPIYSILHGTIFAGIGDVYQYDNWHWQTPKVGYGIGLRATINRAKVNIRFDLARNNIDKRWDRWESYSFYLTATEAF